MHINYKPEDGWAGDFIPFYWQGKYHLFYLKDYRDVPGHGEGTPWFHLETEDFIHFRDLGECLARGRADEQDLYVFTGSALHAEGKFHIFYTGHNPHFRAAGKPEQAILHAVSEDLVDWKKVEGDVLFAPSEGYEPHDWRDPFVFWNAAAGEYWMLLAARLKEGPSRRRGCTALYASKDMAHWELKEPFYAPDLYFTHECPDLFQMGEWWYLVFSEFSQACVTRYRMARSPSGPWLTPAEDTFDGHAFYAAKTASDGERRYLFGWNPTRSEGKDSGAWNWGGNLVVHELRQRPDGTLAVDIPATVRNYFANERPLHWERGLKTALPSGEEARLEARGVFRCLSAGRLPEMALLQATAVFQGAAGGFGLMLRSSADFESGYFLRLEPQRGRLVFDSWPRPGEIPFQAESERPLLLREGQPIRLTVYVDGSICEAYVDGQVALSTRMYDHPAGEWGVFVQDGDVTFSEVGLFSA